MLVLVAGCVIESPSEYQCLLHREWHVAFVACIVKRSYGMGCHGFLTVQVQGEARRLTLKTNFPGYVKGEMGRVVYFRAHQATEETEGTNSG